MEDISSFAPSVEEISKLCTSSTSFPQELSQSCQHAQSTSQSRLDPLFLTEQTKTTSPCYPWMSPGSHLEQVSPTSRNLVHISPLVSQAFFKTIQPDEIQHIPQLPAVDLTQASNTFHDLHIIEPRISNGSNSRRMIQQPCNNASSRNGLAALLPQKVVHPPMNRWQQARDYRRKVYEPPHIDPQSDHTILHVEANAEPWVRQLMIAMTNTQDVKDTPDSHHRRIFMPDCIDDALIESCCREIFTALIDRCRNGFRGPAQFNKALKASHAQASDRTATCEERLGNVIKVLTWNKRACKDVLYEDWKIRLLVNHPLAYDKEKDSQKGSNDQRRKRQLAEREKMEKAEEELKAYRETGDFGTTAVMSNSSSSHALVHQPPGDGISGSPAYRQAWKRRKIVS